jgi:hypothetical protein
VVRDERVGPAEAGAEVRHTHPGLMLEDGPRAWARGMGEEHEHAEPQRISNGPKAANDVVSSECEHHAHS